MVDVPQHKAQIARHTEAKLGGFSPLRAGRQRSTGFDQREMRRKLAGAKARLVKALPPRGTAVENVEMLALAVLCPGAGGQGKMRLDDYSGCSWSFSTRIVQRL